MLAQLCIEYNLYISRICVKLDDPLSRWVSVITAIHDDINAPTWKGVKDSNYYFEVMLYREFWTQEPSGRNVNIGQYVFNSNLKCWILQNVMLYFVCEIMLKLCVLNVKARLLYYKANLILSLSTCQRTRQNVFEYLLSNNLKIRKESPNSSLEEKPRMLPQPPPPQKGKKEKKRKKKKKPNKNEFSPPPQ